jgi:hypothetical protein
MNLIRQMKIMMDYGVGLSFIRVTNVGLVDGWRDNHVLIFYTSTYCIRQNLRTNFSLNICRLLGEDGLPFARLALHVSSSLSLVIAISVVA